MPVLEPHERGAPLSASEREALLCTSCGGWMRPHVLWFDEYYEEAYYRSESAFELAASASILVVVGTTGSTSLPMQIGMHCVRRGVPVIDVNVEANPFAEMAARTGMVVRQPASEAVPAIVSSLFTRLGV
jgi:NAD-dependent deacetylase